MRATTPVGLLLLALVAGCGGGGEDDQRTETVTPERAREAREAVTPAARARLDEANAAFRERSFEDALRLYEEASELDPDAPAAWFGIYMAHSALGNVKEADEAIRRARDLAPGTTLVEEEDERTGRGAGSAVPAEPRTDTGPAGGGGS